VAGKHTKRSWLARTFAPDMKSAEFETKEIGDFPFDGYDSAGMPLISFSPGLVSAIRGEDAQMLDFSSLYRTSASVYTVVDFLAWHRGDGDMGVDIGFDYDNTSAPLHLQWSEAGLVLFQ